jgi:putative ABC transport system permease protein
VRNGLLIAQLAVTLVLVCGAGLFVRSFLRLIDVPVGFDPRGRVSLRLTLSGARYPDDPAYRAFADRLLTRAQGLPGMAAVAIDTSSALDSGPLVRLIAAGGPRPAAGSEPSAIMRSISADYFRALGMPLLAGRAFTPADDAGPRVAIVSDYLAGVLFPGQPAVGKRLELLPGARTPWTRRPGVYEIVGVAHNAKEVSINEVEMGAIYVPFALAPSPRIELIAASTLPTDSTIDALRRALAEEDSWLPASRVQTLSDRVDFALRSDRFNALLISVFAAAAILLAAVGVYGAMSCAIRERTREFGVRLALGLSPGALVRSTLRESVRFGVVGSLAGLAVVLVLARVLGNALYLVRGQHNGLLYGVSTTDPLALGIAVAGLILVAAVAGLAPAREAARVDPLITLRSE